MAPAIHPRRIASNSPRSWGKYRINLLSSRRLYAIVSLLRCAFPRGRVARGHSTEGEYRVAPGSRWRALLALSMAIPLTTLAHLGPAPVQAAAGVQSSTQ